VAAQSSGAILNYSKIARDIGADHVTTQSYFQILEDTLLGFFLEPYHRSIRKRQTKAPKFYFFDLGILHALEKSIQNPQSSMPSLLGRDFEHFIILEIFRLIHYFEKDWKLSYLCTKDEAEIDLIIERPGIPLIAIEIKSSERIEKVNLGSFLNLSNALGKNVESYVFSRDKLKKRIEHVHCLPWQEGFKAIGLI
jgi:predicted AAA+ superfamily ATPase